MRIPLLPLLLVVGPLACMAADSAQPGDPTVTWIDPADPSVAAIRRTGEPVIARIGSTLIYEVERTIADKGLAGAVEVVHLRNLALPKPEPGQPQVTAIKRTSLLIRNPDNAPDAADRAALEKIKTALEEGAEVPKLLIQRLDRPEAPPEWRVYRPITIMPQCIKCHGPKESQQPEVRTSLARRFPGDQAVDYSVYSWRGVIRLSLAAPEPAAPGKNK